tara:strand:+ start:637 stop:1287 length:651 start_codon:yes stop_codon:yes gene_type:complete
MKKIISLLVGSLFLTTSALAVSGMVGIKVGNGSLEATKKAITNTPAALTEAAETDSIDHMFGAIFAEMGNVADSPVSLGLEYTPLTGTVSISGKNHTDASVELSNLKTIYALASKDVANGGSVYAKVGYSHADIENAKQSNGTTTINSFSDTLEGPMVGVGFQAAETNGIVFRAEATLAQFDDVQVVTTDADSTQETKKAGDIEFTTFTISLAKQF